MKIFLRIVSIIGIIMALIGVYLLFFADQSLDFSFVIDNMQYTITAENLGKLLIIIGLINAVFPASLLVDFVFIAFIVSYVFAGFSLGLPLGVSLFISIGVSIIPMIFLAPWMGNYV